MILKPGCWKTASSILLEQTPDGRLWCRLLKAIVKNIHARLPALFKLAEFHYFLSPLALDAQVTEFTPNTGSNWNDAANWDNGIPDSTKEAHIGGVVPPFVFPFTAVIDGFSAEADDTVLARNTGEPGILFVQNGGTLQTGGLFVGGLDQGTLNITAGGQVTATSTRVGAAFNGSGTINVSGAGSSLTTNFLSLEGAGGPANLNISGGGLVQTSTSFGFVTLGNDFFSNPSAQITLSGTAGSRGVLATRAISRSFDSFDDTTTATITFDGGVFRAQDDRTEFLQNFLAGTVTLNAGGGFFDSNGFAIQTAQGLVGAGALTKEGAGTLTLSGANTYSGGTTFSAGTLQLGDGGTTGSITGNVTNNGNLTFNRSDDLTFSNIISETGSLTKLAANTLTLTGANTYSGGTTINAGTLQIGSGGTTGSISGNIINNSNLTFNRADPLAFGGNVSGTGTLTKLGGSTLGITGDLTHTGGTTISAGTLNIGNGGATGSIAGNIINNGELVFSRTNASTYAGDSSGTGQLTKISTGILTLTGANTHTGGTLINAGTLQIGNGGTTGSISGNITNNANLTFNRSDALTYGGVISGSGSVTQDGTGV
ncbi:MAG: autotransporter-associated beta strand repeat-containing protein, partial [Candidatus Methylacidiphilales bacterium]